MNILDIIGDTPLIKVGKNIFAKLESRNPGGSVKDRPVSKMIISAIKSGKLTKNKIILDATSGNTGISIAMVAANLKFKAVLVMPESMSVERRKIISSYGAKIILVSGGMDDAIIKAKQISKDKRYFYLDQFSNGSNVFSHYETTGPEIWEQTKGKITHLVAGIGSGGTIMGTGKFLKEKNPEINVIGVEPDKNSNIPGLKNMSVNNVPEIFDFSMLDEKLVVSENQAVAEMKELVSKGIFAGMSSGAAMCAAKKIAGYGKLIVVIFPDGGEKYLSTSLFD